MDKIQILNDLYKHKNFTQRTDFAKFLGITPQSLNHWFTRGTYDVELLAKKFPEVSPKWLLLGEGAMLENAEKETTGSADERPSVPDMAYFDRLVEKICELSAEVKQLRQENEHLRTIHLDTITQPPAAAV